MVLPILAVIAGLLLGMLSGLIPGIHSNTIASTLAAAQISHELFAYVVVAALGAHLIFSFFPSVFLSVPDSQLAACALPGHRMTMQGRGIEAIEVCVLSALIASLSSALFFPAALVALPAIYSNIEPFIPAMLAAASIFLAMQEKKAEKILLAAFVFLLSGLLGLATLRLGMQDPLFPSFSGLFAASGIILSAGSQRWLSAQRITKTKLDFLPFVFVGAAFGMLSDLLPGMAAPAQIAAFASILLPPAKPKQFLALVSSIAASHAVFSFAALMSIGKAREGSIAIMQEVAQLQAPQLPALLGVLLASMGLAGVILLKAAKKLAQMQALGSKEFGLLMLAYLAAAIMAVCGWKGLVVFCAAAAIGILPPLLGVRRIHLMGIIILPSIMMLA
ncbi:MAG: tripartite tricarboxylate transporter permease [Candidatus Micrarchaeota archaeon]|nr:tripartite tricarboxylate transporter permease [Candidatus Micrarchaeota archaeon]